MSYSDKEDRDIAKETRNVYEFAKEMIENINEVNADNNISLNMRIGIH